ncbi:hypothetical protein EXU29_13265 [Acinetobacter wuhouensis]|uniref:hypothetical protein n=1 Tax=Acinetobacter wuhouensis TaxID=1879050 RepID=UPI00102385AB|nr:hypothetical protein [Acinetobacter wuhouensis]RZG71601.1 hypothetical protein EXU29_13265 [Acinetobacter wuhouensis]
MIKINMIPLHGIDIENIGHIALGQSQTELIHLLGQPAEHSDAVQLYYDQYELRIDLNQNKSIEFIEFINGPYPEKLNFLFMVLIHFKLMRTILSNCSQKKIMVMLILTKLIIVLLF